MATLNAVCIRCGHPKKRALGECESCGFTPSSSEDVAKSLILSKAFDAGEDVIGHSSVDLVRIGAEIRAGAPFGFDPLEVAHVQRSHDAARAITGRALLISAIRWLGPPVLLLGGLFWLLSFA
jgi:hypothetical protein